MKAEEMTIDDYVLRFYRILTDAQTIVNKLVVSHETVTRQRDELLTQVEALKEKTRVVQLEGNQVTSG